jgi:hypothetical protein
MVSPDSIHRHQPRFGWSLTFDGFLEGNPPEVSTLLACNVGWMGTNSEWRKLPTAELAALGHI